MKTCLKCGTEKALLDFQKRSCSPDGIHPWCKGCVSEYSKSIRNKPHNLEKDRERSRAWQEKHSDRAAQYRAGYYVRNKEKIKRQSREWYGNNKEVARARNHRWYLAHRDTEGYRQYMAEKSAEYNKRERFSARLAASRAVYLAIRSGLLVKQPCSVCGTSEEIHAHHHNGYALADWFNVTWLCAKHHREAHGATTYKTLEVT